MAPSITRSVFTVSHPDFLKLSEVYHPDFLKLSEVYEDKYSQSLVLVVALNFSKNITP